MKCITECIIIVSQYVDIGSISLLLPRLPKLHSECHSNGLSNLGKLGSSKEAQPKQHREVVSLYLYDSRSAQTGWSYIQVKLFSSLSSPKTRNIILIEAHINLPYPLSIAIYCRSWDEILGQLYLIIPRVLKY